MAISLPSNWADFTPQQKIDFFNQNNVTENSLKSTGVPTSDIEWLKSNGYTPPKTAANGNLIIDNSKLGDQGDGTYYGLTTLNGQQIYATTDEQGNLIRAATAPTSNTQNSVITQLDSQGNSIGTSVYQPQTETGFLGAIGNIGKGLGGLALGAAFPGLASTIGASLGATGAAASAIGGAALGGLTSAATGGNVLQGAALGGLGGYLNGAPSGPMGADYTVPQGPQSLDSSFNQYLAPTAITYPVPDQTPFSGTSMLDNATVAPSTTFTPSTTVTPSTIGANYGLNGQPYSSDFAKSNLTDMGGGQGLTPSTGTSLAGMNGGQGISDSISANLTNMGGGQGLTTGAFGGGTLGQTGINTGANLLGINPLTGQTLGTALSSLNTGIYNPTAIDYSLTSEPYTTGATKTNLDSMGGGQGITTNPNPNLVDMGGGQGIVDATSANLTSMGGGQGITAPASGGGTLGATGVNTGGSVLGVNTLTGNTLGTTLADIKTGLETGQISTAGGLSLTNNITGAPLGADLAAVDTGIPKTVITDFGKVPFGTDVTPAVTTPAVTTPKVTTPGVTAPAVVGAGAGLTSLTGLTGPQIATIGSILGGVAGNTVANTGITNAQNIQNAAAATAQSNLKDIYDKQLGFTKPYQELGVQGTSAISKNLPYFQHQFDANDLNTNLAPNYAFQLGQGQMANQRAANVGGGALSGNTLTGLNRYTQDYAGNAYQQAFNNYNTQRSNIYNTLSGIAGLGQASNAQAIGAGNTYGTNTTNLTTGLAAAQAGANVAQSTNNANTLNNIVNNAALLLGQNNSPGQSNANLATNPYFSPI